MSVNLKDYYEFQLRNRQGMYDSFNVNSNLDYLQTAAYMREESDDSDLMKTGKSFYNGAMSIGRGMVGALQMLRDENIRQHQENDPDYVINQEAVDILDNAAKSSILQRYDVQGESAMGNLWFNFVEGLGQFAGQATATMATGGVAGTAILGAQVAGNQYMDLREQGVDQQRALKAAVVNAAVQAPMEKFGLNKVLGKIPIESNIRKKAFELLEGMATEGLTEFAQTFPEQLTNIYAKNEGLDARGIAREWDKNAAENLKEAGYSGIIGALVGGAGRSIKIAQSSMVEYMGKKIHAENLEMVKRKIDHVKKTGVDADFAGRFIDSTLQGQERVLIESDKLQVYMQETNAEQVAQTLHVTVEEVNEAVKNGLDVDVSLGAFTATCVKHEGLFDRLKDHVAFDDEGRSVNMTKLKEALRSEYEITEQAREELDIEIENIRQGLLSAGASKQVVDAYLPAFVNVAMTAYPENPAQYYKDNPLDFDRLTKTSKWLSQIAYHGTNAKFEKFDLGLVGNNGTTAYGWGLFFAKDKSVASAYGDINLEVDIPNDDVLLDEHLTFSQQPKKVQTALKKLVNGLTDEQLYNIDDVGRLGRAKVIAKVMDMLKDSDGQGIYGTIWDIIGDSTHGKETSLLLNKFGIKGKKFTDSNAGEQFIVFDDNAAAIIEKYNQEHESETKGTIGWNEEGKAIISFFQKADASTVIHETGHYFIENFMRMSAMPNATEQMKRDRKALLDYAGMTEEEWNNADFEGRRKAHERWAEAYESYLMEGKAPKRELRKMFRRFKDWLMAVYKSISRNQNSIPLTDDVRQVFDRMFATEEEIATMERMDGYFNTLPKVITENLSEKSKERLKDFIDNAREKAIDILTKESMRNFTAERRAKINAYRKRMRPQVELSLQEMPIYAVTAELQQYMEVGKQTPRVIALRYINTAGREYDDWRRELTDVNREIDERLNPIIEELKKGYGQGSREFYIDRETGEEVDVSDFKGKEELATDDHYQLVKDSYDAEWYQAWTKEHGNVEPTNKQLRELAYDIFIGNDRYGFFGGMTLTQSQEEAEYFAAAKEEIDYFLQRQSELLAFAQEKRASYHGNHIRSYKDALMLHDKTVPVYKVEQFTGWRLKDGEWTKDIADDSEINTAEIREAGKRYALKNIYQNSTLFKMYPGLKDVIVLSSKESDFKYAEYNSKFKVIRINPDAKNYAANKDFENLKKFNEALHLAVAQAIVDQHGIPRNDIPVLKLDGVAVGNIDPNAKSWKPKGLSESDRITFEMLAEKHGFDSGDAMAKAISESPTFAQAVNQELDKLVKMTFPDIITEREEAEKAAREALYNDDSGLVIGWEQILIEEAAQTELAKQRSNEAKVKLAKARIQHAKNTAKEILGSMTLERALKTRQFTTAERRAAANAKKAMKAGEYDEALEYKHQQMVLHEMVRESLKMRQEVDRAKRFLKRQRSLNRKNWGNEGHFNQAAALLVRMGIVRKDYDASTKTQSLAEYCATAREVYGDIVDIADWLLDENVQLTNPMGMTLDAYMDVINALKNIRAISMQDQVTAAIAKGIVWEEFKNETKENLNKLDTKFEAQLGKKQKASWFENIKAGVRSTDNLFELMDGWTYGYFSKVFGGALKHAADLETRLVMEYEQFAAKAYKKWLPDRNAEREAARMVAYEELGNGDPGNTVSADKFTLVYMLANLGNDGNARVLCTTPPLGLENCQLWVKEGDGITQEQAVAMTRENIINFLAKYLTVADVEYAQSLIDNASRNWNLMVNVERNTKGFSPKKVEATPVVMTLANGQQITMQGGYFPLVRNGEYGSHPAGQNPVSDTDSMQGRNITTMHTNTGATKARVKANYPIDLSRGAEMRSVYDSMHDIAYREVMLDFRKLLNDPEMFELFKKKLGIATMRQFREMLEKAAAPYSNSGMELAEWTFASALNWLRKKTVNTAIMLNLKTAFQNLGNVFLYGNVVDGFDYKDVVAALGRYGIAYDPRADKLLNELCAKSVFMQERVLLPDITVRDIKGENDLNAVEKEVLKYGAMLLAYTDNLTAKPMWAQAYSKKIEAGATEQEAIDFADTVIRRTLGSSRIQDVSSIQRGSAIFKLFTTFQGFFNTQLNQWIREANITRRMMSEGQKKDAMLRLSAFVASKYLFSCMAAIALSLENPFNDDDDDGYMRLSQEMLNYPLSMFGFVGQGGNYLLNRMLGIRTYSYRMLTIENTIEKGGKVAGLVEKVWEGEADLTELIEPTANIAGIVVGVPAQFNRIVFNAYDWIFNGMDFEAQDIIKRRPKDER